MRSFHLLMAALFIGFGLTASAQCDVYISEYSEGSSSNKYIELYNPTSQPIDLSQYAIASVGNDPTTVGVHEYWNTFTEGATIAPGDVYVWANGSSDPAIIAETIKRATHTSMEMTATLLFSVQKTAMFLWTSSEILRATLDLDGKWPACQTERRITPLFESPA